MCRRSAKGAREAPPLDVPVPGCCLWWSVLPQDGGQRVLCPGHLRPRGGALAPSPPALLWLGSAVPCPRFQQVPPWILAPPLSALGPSEYQCGVGSSWVGKPPTRAVNFLGREGPPFRPECKTQVPHVALPDRSKPGMFCAPGLHAQTLGCLFTPGSGVQAREPTILTRQGLPHPGEPGCGSLSRGPARLWTQHPLS